MSVVIRLNRGGKKAKPFYRVVVADKRFSRDGRFIERVGHYNPVFNIQGDQVIELNLERVQHWIEQGAIPSPRVMQLIKRQKKEQAANENKSEPANKDEKVSTAKKEPATKKNTKASNTKKKK